MLMGIDYFCDLRVEVELALSQGDRRSVRVRGYPCNVPQRFPFYIPFYYLPMEINTNINIFISTNLYV